MINPECVVDRGGGINRYEILLKVESPGHYVGCVKYEGAVIGPSSLNIISLCGEWAEYKCVHNRVNHY